MMEPLCLGSVLGVKDGSMNDTRFLQRMLDELRESHPQLIGPSTRIVTTLRVYIAQRSPWCPNNHGTIRSGETKLLPHH